MKTMTLRQQARNAEKEVSKFNDKYSIGQKVRVYTGIKGNGAPSVETKTTSLAQALGGHTAVVWTEDVSSCIALTHVIPLTIDELTN